MSERLQAILARRIGGLEQSKAQAADHAARKRAMFPTVAQCVDDIRAALSTDHHGRPIKGDVIAGVPYGREPDGRRFGKPGPRGVPPSAKFEPLAGSKEPVRVRVGKTATKDRWWNEKQGGEDGNELA